MSTDTTKYERTDYAALAKEFGCHLRFGKRGVKFFPRDPDGNIYKLFQVTPLDGWITDPKILEHIVKENGYEL